VETIPENVLLSMRSQQHESPTHVDNLDDETQDKGEIALKKLKTKNSRLRRYMIKYKTVSLNYKTEEGEDTERSRHQKNKMFQVLAVDRFDWETKKHGTIHNRLIVKIDIGPRDNRGRVTKSKEVWTPVYKHDNGKETSESYFVIPKRI